MFQSFDPPPASSDNKIHLAQLRRLMNATKLDGFVVPRADEHQGEYVPPGAERLAWLTGFTGSAGLAVITRKAAALFVDGRYMVQAPAQVNTEQYEILQIPDAKPARWLKGQLPKGGVIGFDPKLHTVSWVEVQQRALKAYGITLKPVGRNLVDLAWGRARPGAPNAPVSIHPKSYAGISASDKLDTLRAKLHDARQDAVILTQPDSICWLFNIRGSDVAHNPVVLAYAIIPVKGKAELFVAGEKIGRDVLAHIKPVARLMPPADLVKRLRSLKQQGRRVGLDPASASWWIYRALGGTVTRAGKSVVRAKDPCALAKAVKNATEIRGAREAHIRDGVAMCRFLSWIDKAPIGGAGGIDEITVVRQLEAFRVETGALRDISFDTIAGSGPHGAIVHYRVDETSNRKLKSGELLLLDSGGQYRDGTTDITRTIAIGKPTRDMRHCYTGVLKGHIAIATARFPKGTRGIDLDPFARRALWQLGHDYDHGTGHGVGSFLSVHEGPQSISRAGMCELEPGMIVSNEPGFYKKGAFGIRLENLVLVTPPAKITGGTREMMGFEDLTLAPFDRRLIDPSALSVPEKNWLNAYHSRLRKTLAPLLDPSTRKWLIQMTQAL